MAWVRIDDQFTDHPKAAEAGPLGIAMQVAALCYSNRHLTDGYISYAVAARLLDWTGIAEDLDWDKPDQQVMGFKVNWQAVAEKCENAGLWDAVDGGWQIHDYLEYNPSRADAQAKRQDISAKRREAGSKGLANRWQTPSKRESKPKQNDSPNPNPIPPSSSFHSEEEEPPVALATSPTGAKRGGRMPAKWPAPADLDEMDAYGESLGIGADDVASHIREFADYWQSATKNATSMDWVKRWRSRFSQDVREGKIGAKPRAPNGTKPNGSAAATITGWAVRRGFAAVREGDEGPGGVLPATVR